MTEPPGRIVIAGLTKSFGAVRAVDDLSFTVDPGTITGFLGANGAGKTTTLRLLLGLVVPDAGEATIDGCRYQDLPRPNAVVGAALDTSGFHPARTGRNHLRAYCRVNGFPADRPDQVLELVGLAGAADRRVRGYSLGMRQRLALATAMLGDPRVLVLDEPANGLDPQGIVWMRGLLRDLARQGRTVLVSSHVLTEVQQLVDDVVIIRDGRLVTQGSLAELAGTGARVMVRTPEADRLAAVLERAGGPAVGIDRTGPDTLELIGIASRDIGGVALRERIELHELTTRPSDLEAVYFSLTDDDASTLQEVS